VPVLPGQLPLPFAAHRPCAQPGAEPDPAEVSEAGPAATGGTAPATSAPDAAPHDDQEQDTPLPVPVPVPGRAPVPGELLKPAVAAVLGGLGALPDALTRARAATAALFELETARLAVVALRRTAVVATGLSARELAAELGLSVGAACDLRASARGRRRRPGR